LSPIGLRIRFLDSVAAPSTTLRLAQPQTVGTAQASDGDVLASPQYFWWSTDGLGCLRLTALPLRSASPSVATAVDVAMDVPRVMLSAARRLLGLAEREARAEAVVRLRHHCSFLGLRALLLALFLPHSGVTPTSGQASHAGTAAGGSQGATATAITAAAFVIHIATAMPTQETVRNAAYALVLCPRVAQLPNSVAPVAMLYCWLASLVQARPAAASTMQLALFQHGVIDHPTLAAQLPPELWQLQPQLQRAAANAAAESLQSVTPLNRVVSARSGASGGRTVLRLRSPTDGSGGGSPKASGAASSVAVAVDDDAKVTRLLFEGQERSVRAVDGEPSDKARRVERPFDLTTLQDVHFDAAAALTRLWVQLEAANNAPL
jgi:hypothetical protein